MIDESQCTAFRNSFRMFYLWVNAKVLQNLRILRHHEIYDSLVITYRMSKRTAIGQFSFFPLYNVLDLEDGSKSKW